MISEIFLYSSNNESTLRNCSSGGVFYDLASYILDLDGVVFGAKLNPIDGTVQHTFVEKKDDLLPLCKSKYVFSDIKNVTHSFIESVKSGRYVLFVGTPCQINLLYSIAKKYDLYRQNYCGCRYSLRGEDEKEN